MTEISVSLLDVAEKNTQDGGAESISETLEQESRRYSTRFEEEEEARLR